jgi:hypothetical protein
MGEVETKIEVSHYYMVEKIRIRCVFQIFNFFFGFNCVLLGKNIFTCRNCLILSDFCLVYLLFMI